LAEKNNKKPMVKTIKQQRLAKAVADKNNIGRPLSDIAQDVGYAKGSRSIYRNGTKRHILDALSKEGITRSTLTQSLQQLGTLAVSRGELNVAHNSIVSIAKLAGLMTSEQSITINQANVLDSIRAVDRAEALDSKVIPSGEVA
jgi:hypothetical protein